MCGHKHACKDINCQLRVSVCDFKRYGLIDRNALEYKAETL